MPVSLASVRQRLDSLAAELAALVGELQEIVSERTFEIVDAPRVEPLPLAATPKATPAVSTRKRYYVVIVARGASGVQPGGQPGIYNSYSQYAEQVRDLSVAWSGRGPIAFAAGSISEGFAYMGEAEDFWRDNTKQPVLRRF